MPWSQRDKDALHFVFTYVGRGATANIEHLSAQIPESHFETDDRVGWSWSYACVSPPQVGLLDGMQLYFHVEDFDGDAPVPNARFAKSDAVCVLLGPARQLVPSIHYAVVRKHAEAAGIDWPLLPVAVQLQSEIHDEAAVAELKQLLGEFDRPWFDATPATVPPLVLHVGSKEAPTSRRD